uniref:Uncharacterized protein n=1 Tax=Pyxicephalus adspersus TaxID=30357 RepID=A0AAV2ZZU7_PYXAD|nr:TPA: hypothetical protein GDO54_015995 [Pyxicephalus adspersus]
MAKQRRVLQTIFFGYIGYFPDNDLKMELTKTKIYLLVWVTYLMLSSIKGLWTSTILQKALLICTLVGFFVISNKFLGIIILYMGNLTPVEVNVVYIL